MASQLIAAGGSVHARNRRGCEPLHAAAAGSPNSPMWDPRAQAAAIACLTESGADPPVKTRNGSTVVALVQQSTGRGGSGSPEAEAQQREILALLGHA